VPSLISSGLTIRGDLVGAGDLQVEGKVVGRIEVGHLVIAEGGVVEGDVVAKAVGISGRVRGTIRAASVTLSATAKVEGDILHDVLAIEAGAQLDGQCKRVATAPADTLLLVPDKAIEVQTDKLSDKGPIKVLEKPAGKAPAKADKTMDKPVDKVTDKTAVQAAE